MTGIPVGRYSGIHSAGFALSCRMFIWQRLLIQERRKTSTLKIKKDVGIRLAASALYHVYGKDILPSGPVFWKIRQENHALRVFFRFADALELRAAPGKSFYLAGADGRYLPVDSAVIDGNSILLSSSQVKHPVSVRYAWSDNPNNILYNRQYPAASFCSDDE